MADFFINEASIRLPKGDGDTLEIEPEEFTDTQIAKAHQILEQGATRVFSFMEEAWNAIHARDRHLKLFIYTAELSILEEEIKNNVWGIGTSGMGKSRVIYTVLQAYPKETYEVFTSSSPLAFQYYIDKYGKDAFKEKILFIDEAEASKDTLPVLRAFTGQNPIKPRHLSVREQKLLDIEAEYRPVVNYTSVYPIGTTQIKNRFLFINPDESREQDLAVFELQQALRSSKGMFSPKTQEDLKICRAITRTIIDETRDLDIVVPWKIPNWPYKDKRYLNPMFITFVKSLTRMNFENRQKGDKLITEKVDVKLACELWSFFRKTIQYRVQSSAWEIYELLKDSGVDQQAMATQWSTTHAWIAKEMNNTSEWARQLCKGLLRENLVSRVKLPASVGGGPKPWGYWIKKIKGFEDLEIERDESVL